MSDAKGEAAAARRRKLWAALAGIQDWIEGDAVSTRGSFGWGGPKVEREPPPLETFLAPVVLPADIGAPGDTAGAVLSDPRVRLRRISASGSQNADPIDLDADRAAVDACRRCRLGSGRRNAAYGEGVRKPLVLVIGEGPGSEEDLKGRPFVGPAGRLLDKMLSAVELSREENCYIANIVKCRPPGNRDPAGDEKEACLVWLERQILALEPRIILALGRVAATCLLGSEEGIGRLRGRWFERRGIPLIATYHPSAILRDESLKRPAWEDLKMLKFRISDLPNHG
jgi:DNA polymerase